MRHVLPEHHPAGVEEALKNKVDLLAYKLEFDLPSSISDKKSPAAPNLQVLYLRKPIG